MTDKPIFPKPDPKNRKVAFIPSLKKILMHG
jgi:hypothetical protein